MNRIGTDPIDPASLKVMREGAREGTDWYAYENHAMDSADLGNLRFLLCGSGATFATPPKTYPDSAMGIGWSYVFIGKVNVQTGEIEEIVAEA